MKYCPSPRCPHCLANDSPAEFQDEVMQCSDCGAPLESSVLPFAKTPAPETHAFPWSRAIVMLAVPALLAAARDVLPPGMTLGDAFNPSDREMVGVFAIGINAAVSAFLAIEVIALAVPRWRALRIDGPVGRARLVRASVVLTAVFAAIQALGITHYLNAADTLVQIEPWARALLVPSYFSGAMIALGAAGLIDRRGLGNGFSVLFAARAIEQLVRFAIRAADPLQPHTDTAPPATLLALLALAAITLAMQSRTRSERAVPVATNGVAYRGVVRFDAAAVRPFFPLPLSGVLPMVFPAALINLLSVLRLSHEPAIAGMSTLFDDVTVRASVTFVGGLICVPALAWLFNQPARVAPLLSRLDDIPLAEARAEAHSLFLHGLRRTAPFVIAQLAIVTWLGLQGTVRLPIHPLEACMLAAVCADLVAEWRARRALGPTVTVWTEARPYAARVAVEALRREGIEVFARGLRHRALLQFNGPYVPIDLAVRPANALDAREIISEVLLEPRSISSASRSMRQYTAPMLPSRGTSVATT